MAEKLLQRYGIFLDCANQNAGKKRLRCGGGDVRISCGARDEKACGEKGGGPHIMRGRGRKSLRGEGEEVAASHAGQGTKKPAGRGGAFSKKQLLEK